MEALVIITLLSAVVNLLLGFFVYIRDSSRRINRLFGISAFITAAWVFTNFMMGARQTVFWLKSTSAIGALVPASSLVWILELCNKKITKYEIFLLSSLAIFFSISPYINDLIISNVERVYLGGFEGQTGPLFLSYWIYIFGILFFIIYILVQSYSHAVGINRLQISYILIGAILYIGIVLVVSFILPLIGIFRFSPLDSPSSLFLLLFTAIAITRYHLFEIRVILTEILVGAIGLILLVQAITADTIGWKVFGFILLVLFTILGYLLIKSTLEEIKRRQEIEKLSEQIRISNIRLQAALKALERLDKAKTEFLSIASHQLRTPLTAIKGYLSMIQEGLYGRPSKELDAILNKIYLSNTRLIDLVNSLLDISRIEMGRMEFKFETIQIEKLIESIIEELSIQAKQKNLYLKFKKPERPLPKVKVDESKIRQVILNLIDNAIRYTEEGGVTIKVKNLISAIQISVRDTGIGLTPKEIESLFGMYARGKGMSIFPEGAGLGLYVARKLLEAHLGRIWAESAGKDKGSTFYVDLPIR